MLKTSTEPCIGFAAITKKKNRLKTYKNQNSLDQFYLNNGDEFEIELFNPKKFPILAKISINGKRISERGIILNPGQRVFLERFIDKQERFKFSTYEVEDSSQAKQAILDNGSIKVEFYDESTPQYNHYPLYQWNNTTNPGWINCNTSPSIFNNTTLNSGTGTSLSSFGLNITPTSGVSTFFDTSTIYNTSSTVCCDGLTDSLNNQPKSIETGRVEAGSKSNQDFISGAGSFNSWYSNCYDCKILPISLKPVEVSELINYCTECGAKIKKSTWKFCPTCGNSFK